MYDSDASVAIWLSGTRVAIGLGMVYCTAVCQVSFVAPRHYMETAVFIFVYKYTALYCGFLFNTMGIMFHI